MGTCGTGLSSGIDKALIKLLIISHTPHLLAQGKWYGWGPTVREINFLTRSFAITHISPVQVADDVHSSYAEVDPAVRLVPTRNRGGRGIVSKLKVLVDSFDYGYKFLKEVRHADIIHVRCPANISLIALILLCFYQSKRKWIKYAGDWRPLQDFASYKIQRFIIRHVLSNHVVLINGTYPGEKPFIHHGLNPSYYERELWSTASDEKSKLPRDVVVLFVGSLTPNKGVPIAIQMLSLLQSDQYSFQLYIVGDGPERPSLISLVSSLGLESRVFFEGWKDKEELKAFYKKAHFIVLPSTGEGWPKVISEAMAFGVVPIVSDVSGIRQTLESIGCGIPIKSFDAHDYTEAIKFYLENPEKWTVHSKAARAGSTMFTFEYWLDRLWLLFREQWNLKA